MAKKNTGTVFKLYATFGYIKDQEGNLIRSDEIAIGGKLKEDDKVRFEFNFGKSRTTNVRKIS